MPKRYAVAFDRADGMGRPLELDAAIKRALELAQKDGVRGKERAKLKRRGQERWGFSDLTIKDLRAKLEDRLPAPPVGEAFVIATPNPDRRILVRIVQTAPHVIDTVGTNAIDQIYSFLVRTYPNHVNLGISNCRRVYDGGPWSEHAFDNGYDAGGSQALVAAMSEDVVDHAKRGALPAAQVIAIRRIWTPSAGWHAYEGTDPHTGHTHISGSPLLALPGRTPECAR